MKKRLISLALCLVMMLSIFLTACGEDESAEANDSGKVTLTMLVVTDRQVIYTDAELALLSAEKQAEVKEAQEQYAAVEAQINKVTKAKYNTALKIYYYTAEQYYDALEEKMLNTEIKVAESATANKLYKALTRSEKKLGNTDPVKVYEIFVEQYPEYAEYIANPSVVETPEEELDEDVYPEVDGNQVDILFIGSYDKYVEYIGKGWLAKLNDSLNSTAKKLTAYIYPAFLSAVKYEKNYYAIPNNTIIGEYTALLVNKKMCDKYSDITQITSLATALDLIETVAKYETGIDPYWCDSYEGFTNVHFWNIAYQDSEDEFIIDTQKFSVLGTSYNAVHKAVGVANGSVFEFKNILKDDAFVKQLLALKTIEFEGYRGANGSENEFAVGILKGSGEDIAAYEEDYYTVILENPAATEEDLFGSMFAVANYTTDLSRAMQIVTFLNTDADFRNLFQYGIKGANYKLNGDDCAERTSDNLYDMDIHKTGNMFIAYPDADRGMTYKTLENAKAQDLDVVANPTMGFTIVASDSPDLNLLKVTNEASESFYARIQACTSVEQIQKVISDCIAEIESGVYQGTIASKAMSNVAGGDDNLSAYAIYYIWARAMGYVS